MNTSASESSQLVLHLEGFDGPLDLLLDLARAQKVDLARISVLALVEQFLVVVESVRLELAAEWLVMAAWLTWLKSRLLVPAGSADAEEGEEAAGVLTERLRALEAIRTAAAWLNARPVLGQDVFARGAPEDHTEIDRSKLALDVAGLDSRISWRGAAGRDEPALHAEAADCLDREGGFEPAVRDARLPPRLDQPGTLPPDSPARSGGTTGGSGEHADGGA